MVISRLRKSAEYLEQKLAYASEAKEHYIRIKEIQDELEGLYELFPEIRAEVKRTSK